LVSPASSLNDSDRQSADVRPAVSAISAHVHAAEGDAYEFAASARAMDLPSEVLATPGGPNKQRMGLHTGL